MSDDRLIDVGMMLKALPRPMDTDEVRGFANRMVDDAVDASLTSVAGLAWMELKPRGATMEQAEQLARAILDVMDPKRGLSLTAARKIVAAVWAGVMITK